MNILFGVVVVWPWAEPDIHPTQPSNRRATTTMATMAEMVNRARFTDPTPRAFRCVSFESFGVV